MNQGLNDQELACGVLVPLVVNGVNRKP